MASVVGDRAGLGLFTALALALGVGCGAAETALSITVIAGDEVARPNALNVAWLSDRGTIFQRDDVPVATEGPLASIFVRLDRSDTSDRRVLVRGMGPGGAASIGAIRVPYASAANQTVSVTLRAALADDDGDGTPDVIDDCAGSACAPRVDGGVPTDGSAPPSAPDSSDGQAAADAEAPADSDPGMEETRVHPRPPSAGLVALWEMDDGAGTMVRDSSGHGNAGTIMRPTATNWAPGQQGTALLLGGTSWMSVPASSRYDALKGLTLSAWVFWAQSTSAGQVVMARQRGTGSQNAFWLGMANNRLHFSVEDLGISGILPSGRWVHVAGTYDGSRVILYVGGVEIGRGTVAPTVTSGARGVSVGADVSGADPTAGSSMFVGRLDDVAIHDRALTAGEIADVAK